MDAIKQCGVAYNVNDKIIAMLLQEKDPSDLQRL